MKPLVSRPLTVGWDAPPDVVAASIQRAIDDHRYEDAGHPEWSLWLVRGSVEGREVNLRLDTHSEPGSHPTYPYGFDLRGELVPRGSGTMLVARAAMLGAQSERPIAIGGGLALGIPMLLVGGLMGMVLCIAVIAALIALYWILMTFVGRGLFSALPQVEAVLRAVGTTSA